MQRLALLVLLVPAQAEKRDLPYREIEGVLEDFRAIRDWRSYYWRDDFTMVVRDDRNVRHRVISREPTPWNNLRLGTMYTGLSLEGPRRPRVRVIGVQGIDRSPAEFHGLKLDASSTVTAFIVRAQEEDRSWRDFYVNNWFHDWGAETNREMLRHYANDDLNTTVYGFLGGIAAPFDAEGKKLLEKFEPDWGGIIYHGRVVKGDAGYEVRLLHLMGRNKKTARYDVFHGDRATLVPLDGRKPRFVDVTAASGLWIGDNTAVGGTNAHAVAVEDFDADGRFDVIVPTFGAPHVRYFRNRGGLKFEDVTKGSGLETFDGSGTGAATADFDRDGRLDVYITTVRGGASRLYRGKGDGTFTDASEKAGVLLRDPARSCAGSDVDGDGWTDLYVTCPDGASRLFRNNRDGTFTNIAEAAGVALRGRHTLGCAFGDVDGDGLDDLFVACYKSQPSALFRNLGGGRFRDVTDEAGLARKASAVGAVFGDLTNRGVLDLYVTTDSWLSGANSTEPQLRAQGHTVEPNAFYANDGKGRFAPIEDAALAYKSLSHDAILEDLDHDGRIDLYVGVDAQSGNRFATSKGGNPLWTRSGAGWTEASAAWGVRTEANCVCVPAADFDGDGDLDLLLVNFYQNLVLYRNDTNGKDWLRVKAIGAKSNPDGIGAKVRVFGADGALDGFREIQTGAGYCRSSPLEAHFGLGKSASPCRVEVLFPATKSRVVVEGVKPGQRLVVREP